jgi:phosphohistidine phosphatase
MTMNVPAHCFRQSAVLASRENRILLVSTSKGHWTIPKGVVERHLTAAQSAAQEAFEEGGIRGTVREPSVGWFEYEKWGGHVPGGSLRDGRDGRSRTMA